MKVLKLPYSETSNAIVLDDSEKWVHELYVEVNKKIIEIFGKRSLAYKTIIEGIDKDKITGSKFFFNSFLNSFLPGGKHIPTLDDLETIHNFSYNFLNGIYTDTSHIILYSSIPSYQKDENILNNLFQQIKKEKLEFSSENPLIISGLEMVKDNNHKNEYGLLFKVNEKTQFKNDLRFSYNNSNKEIHFGKFTKKVYTKKEGFSGIYQGITGELFSWEDDLTKSSSFGKVVLINE